MTEKETIVFHLTNFYRDEENSLLGFSGFCGALKDARKMTGRNIQTGAKDDSNSFGHLGSWLGTIGYLSLLDQIGKCFRKIDVPAIDPNKSGIIKALVNFSDLTIDEIDAVYALRNSFAHDYSLQNIGKRAGLTHHFVVSNSATSKAVILPSQNWDGLAKKTDSNVTQINLQGLGDIVEQIVERLIGLVNADQVELILSGGKEQLIETYSFITNDSAI